MPVPAFSEYATFDYAIVRVVPRVERAEFVNVGVILFCLQRRFLKAVIAFDSGKLLALAPDLDPEFVGRHLEAYPRVCEGLHDAGPIAALTIRERFHWLVSPRSTIIQVSPVHSGLCADPEAALHSLLRGLQ